MRTTLADLSIPEYNFGFMSLINSAETYDHDKPFMYKHLARVNQDASVYEWDGVRAWSEEVCALIAEGKLTWDVEYRTDLLRLKLSQQRRLTSLPSDHGPRPAPRTPDRHDP